MLKIESVDTYVLKTALDKPFAYSQGWVTGRSTTVVRIRTTDGIEGWGETFSVGLQPPEIAETVIESALKPLLLGKNPLDTEVLWNNMYVRTRDFGRKGVVLGAISAVDIALWDICGKVANQPVWQLLGGAFRQRVQCYATGFFRPEGQGQSAAMAAEAKRHESAGFSIMKVKLGFGLNDDIAVMHAIRDTLAPETQLMVDVNHAYSANEAIRLGRALDAMRLRWLEEPVVPEDLAGYRRVRDAIDTPIAGGEAEFSMYGFHDLFAAGAVDIAQPDICLAGGFTALRHINALAQVHGVKVNPHVWGTAVGQYASLHMIAATPDTHYALYADQPLFEYDTSSHPFRTALVTQPLEQRNGWLDVPDRPGLGFELDRAFFDKTAIRIGH
ncbi:D-galactarolactone cycloisomerase [Paraburkholderia tropica]|uniref:D-galactarolactone cycloisomerase n=1 Tax=Paraburkholderia tropica TaxID=92647 RepID=A0ABX5MU40_9BURK|nr:mandelate racemase/muconate lactonizing enzyme family protein [Paraburkholderia tropica]PXX19128.1 D-galactarolactone cycloisomerase [Paraburkholderia tropica]PZW88151.1 D-galactarolactone cycloisomerase [Paraburkholderia tropica]